MVTLHVHYRADLISVVDETGGQSRHMPLTSPHQAARVVELMGSGQEGEGSAAVGRALGRRRGGRIDDKDSRGDTKLKHFGCKQHHRTGSTGVPNFSPNRKKTDAHGEASEGGPLQLGDGSLAWPTRVAPAAVHTQAPACHA